MQVVRCPIFRPVQWVIARNELERENAPKGVFCHSS
jgi:hypothetical protein